MRILPPFSVLLGLAACGGTTIDDNPTAETATTGGEQAGTDADGGGSIAPPDPATDPASASLDEPPPRAPTAPATLVAQENLPAEGTIREEPRPEGGVRLVLVLPAAADGNAILEIQTTPGRSGDLASFAVRARHAAPQWTNCTSLGLVIDGRATVLPDARVIAGPTSESGALETATATAELREARRLVGAATVRIVACDEPFTLAPATRPTLERFLARVDELARAAAPAPVNRRR